MSKQFFLIILILLFPGFMLLQAQQAAEQALPVINDVEAQPLFAQALRLKDALTFLGSSLSDKDQQRLSALEHRPQHDDVSKAIQQILDPYCLAMVSINPESRVKVQRGPAPARLMQDGWVSYLVKVHNEAGITAALQVESANAAAPLYPSSYTARVPEKRKLTAGQVANRFLEMQLYRNPPLLPRLSGLKLEYVVLQIYSKTDGKREAEISFHAGQGTQDIGFRNSIPVLFNITKPVKVIFQVKDDDGSPATASFIISDGIERVLPDSADISKTDFRLSAAQRQYWESNKAPAMLKGIYPLPSRRVAAYDKYPDFFFQPQVYRADGEHVLLPPGKFSVHFTRGPEYILQEKELIVPKGKPDFQASFRLKRWINMAKLGWYSADHHVHAAGCSHYESPEEGVKPTDMWRQAVGEDLNVAAVLAWGPGWYHQKNYFTGEVSSLSTSRNVMRYDIEVSGFPSSHAGHIVLLRLKEDDYPGTSSIEDWPSWTLPVFTWAKSQNAVTGYAHSGWGLEPQESTKGLPNYITPKMDGIGANEYVVTVTKNVVDFYSAGDTPLPWEMNMWYHTLNAGFTTRLSGETDFPCIFDDRVGMARSYFKPEGKLSFDAYVNAISKGRSYVSDGKSHIIDFSVNGQEPGIGESRLSLKGHQRLSITGKVAAYLPEKQDEEGKSIASTPWALQPYWHIERARIGQSRKVPVELIVNGVPVEKKEITADGNWTTLSFTYSLEHSSWVALRVLGSSHTNPVFVIIDNKPIAEKESAAWCLKAVEQCWKMKQDNIRPAEREAAKKAYDEAKEVYQRIIAASR
jgi:hypothetical protein